METKTIKAGQWIVNEGKHPYFHIYKLLKGKVSVYKGGAKIREVEIKEGMKPIMPGITAALSEDHKHTASVKAESDIEVEIVPIDTILGIIRNEVPKNIRNDISIMTRLIIGGNEIIRQLNDLATLPKVELEIPNNVSSQTIEVLSEVKRLYTLINADIASITEKK